MALSTTVDTCRACAYVCKCCSASDDSFRACTNCSKDFNMFIPAKHILYCPLSGDVVRSSVKSHCVVMGTGVNERERIQKALEQYFKDRGELRL